MLLLYWACSQTRATSSFPPSSSTLFQSRTECYQMGIKLCSPFYPPHLVSKNFLVKMSELNFELSTVVPALAPAAVMAVGPSEP